MDAPIFLVSVISILTLFVGLPWLIFHYVTQWKKNGTLSVEDENLLDELHALARRLDDRMNTIERIVAADSPSFRPGLRDERTELDEDFELPRSPERATRTRRREH
ncbi:envelope stress response membrane protein PspB [Sphingomonas crusticola]|uniref:envelope stress response membrane protein PspB n=1 Tax=Sphingomonas crusticola TaxID=1697973 RepID=UPI000E230FFC|nr:envelope stress response membrane protein PspB [Sphingomonas crusticola]